ncbi:orotate phosphoribosyltransferase [Candidatus Formimonas warabiya]|uniref:Orotate phosphoribosyltransferase n=1 Tax=Formimonas warabiya TaxID=1761012 RepID=A0A3G1KQZ3_FORW1|nr:orotate phosphoribosyltransferase [Candidatus Formimonas warabiya]ATW24866.1 orotate phosphoribosyltransferase [Candidatus Formimonas warabiya]
MLNQDQALDLFRKSGALLEGHFVLTSGRHSDRYIQCAQVLRYPEYTAALCEEIAARFKKDEIDVVVGPAMGGILVAYEVARHLGVENLFAERENGKMTLRRGFRVQPGQKVLVVEDVVTTGGSVQEVMEVVTGQGAQVVGVGLLVDRSGGKVDFGVKMEAVLTMEVPSWDPAVCPLCQEGSPAVKPGSRVRA